MTEQSQNGTAYADSRHEVGANLDGAVDRRQGFVPAMGENVGPCLNRQGQGVSVVGGHRLFGNLQHILERSGGRVAPAIVSLEKVHEGEVAGAELATRCQLDRALEQPARFRRVFASHLP